jgi:hypothetical protein
MKVHTNVSGGVAQLSSSGLPDGFMTIWNILVWCTNKNLATLVIASATWTYVEDLGSIPANFKVFRETWVARVLLS